MADLTDKQKKFIEEYMIDCNATQAAIRAGYSVKTAMEQGYQLLQKTSVKAAIDNAIEKRSKKTGITAEYVLNGIKAIADRAERESDQLKAYELLGKHLKLFTDKLEHSGETGVRIINDIPRKRS